jgi:uncharacterized protein YjbI with pentapeptide repeats
LYGSSVGELGMSIEPLNEIKRELFNQTGTIFREMNLQNSHFKELELNNCDFTGSDFRNALAESCIFIKCIFTRADLDNAIFIGCTFRSCIFNITASNNSIFTHCFFLNIEGHLCVFNNCQFNECSLRDCDLKETTINNCSFQTCSIIGLITRKGEVLHTHFTQSEIIKIDFADATSRYLNFIDCKLKSCKINVLSLSLWTGVTLIDLQKNHTYLGNQLLDFNKTQEKLITMSDELKNRKNIEEFVTIQAVLEQYSEIVNDLPFFVTQLLARRDYSGVRWIITTLLAWIFVGSNHHNDITHQT